MDLAPLLISEQEAAERLAEYEAQIQDERTVEDDAIRMGYRAAKRGMPVISLREAFRVAGNFPPPTPPQYRWAKVGLPRLAIIRADATAKECFCYSDNGDIVFSDQPARTNRGALVGRDTVRVVGAARDADGQPQSMPRGRTIVPSIPPRHRPRRHRIKGFHIIWEVESWTMSPPQDPALVRHVRGDLWAVIAVWDLTAIERMVLFERAAR